ncbi:MAG: hypothetical protein FWC42_03115 [Proteobacteria bacterium]|nr:hypothetical protein [Pseudomonadota bacterium]
MPIDPVYYSELTRRTRARARKFVAQMNNTKWREVFRIIARHKIGFQIAWVHGEEPLPTIHGLHNEELIDRTGLRDPGIGGPCFYWEILWLRFPYTLQYDNSRGHIRIETQEIAPFLRELRSLGELPINESSQFVELLAYAKPDVVPQTR